MSEPRRPGAPSKLTDEVRAKIVTNLAAGCTLEVAATAAGVTYRTLARWLERGRELDAAIERGEVGDDADGRQGERLVHHARPHPLARLLHRGGGEPHHAEAGEPRAQVHLDLDGSGLEADDGGADDARNDASKHPPTDFTGGAPIVPMRAQMGAGPCAPTCAWAPGSHPGALSAFLDGVPTEVANAPW